MTMNLTLSMKISRSSTGSETCLELGPKSHSSCLRTCFGSGVGPSGQAIITLPAQQGFPHLGLGLLSHSASQPELLMSLGFCPGCSFHQESHSSSGHFSMDKVTLSPTGLLWIASLSSSPLTATPAELCMWLSWHRPPNLVPRQTVL